jgi:hypothetical protein
MRKTSLVALLYLSRKSAEEDKVFGEKFHQAVRDGSAEYFTQEIIDDTNGEKTLPIHYSILDLLQLHKNLFISIILRYGFLKKK